ncbi:MAG: Rrf2 family transcriptional regulator [Actinomycetota bacterium]
MKMSEGIEWSLHCCTVLGSLPPGVALPGARLAEFHDVPPAYLGKQLQRLARAGIVESVAGRKGGFRLGRAAAEITLLDVVEAIEGTAPAFRCTEIRQQGPSAIGRRHYVKPCGIAAAMHRAEDAWKAELRAVTVADLLAELETGVDIRQTDKAITWLTEVLT